MHKIFLFGSFPFFSKILLMNEVNSRILFENFVGFFAFQHVFFGFLGVRLLKSYFGCFVHA